jgi:SNF2 family DNA or RNA helicase
MERQRMVEEFKKPENRLMIASTLVAAEGLNMQFVSDCMMMERQWNPSKEEQAEGRFPRPGSMASKINAVYLIAAGTVDDFLTTLVEQKRRNVAQTLGDAEISWDEGSLVMELARVLQEKGLAKWRLSA